MGYGCGLDVVWMLSRCSLDAVWMRSGCGLDAVWMWLGYGLNVVWMQSGYRQDGVCLILMLDPDAWSWFGNVYFLFQFVILITIIIDETSVLAVISFLLAFTICLLRFYILFCDSAILNSFTQFLFARVWTLLIGTRKKTEKLKKLRQFCKVKVNLIEATVANSIWKK